MYLLSEYEIDEFGKGNIRKDEIKAPENLAVFYYCGEHIKMLLEENASRKVENDELIAGVERVRKNLIDGRCWKCIKRALRK